MLPSSTESSTRSKLGIYAILVLLCLIGNYLYVGQFGIYEDDYFYTVPAFQWSWADCWMHVRSVLLSWPQGRPIGFASNHLIAWLSAQGNSLELGYAFGAALLVTNTLLCYRLASTWFAPLGAFAAAMVYCLNPADTAKVILMHRTFLLLGSTFLLLALLSYRRNRFWLAYLTAALSLLTYEAFFFPFLAAPLLLSSWKEFSWRRLVRHGLVCGAILVSVVLVREKLGDVRIVETVGSIGGVANMICHAVVIGPWTCLRMLFLRPLDALWCSGPSQWFVMIGTVLGTLAVFSKVGSFPEPRLNVRGLFHSFLPFATGCLLLLALCYLVAIHPGNYPPVVTIGRLSGFNAPAAIPLGLLVGATVNALSGFTKRLRWVAAAFGLFAGALASFSLEIQRVDYVRNWQQQRAFWDELLASSGEWESGAVVLVQIEGKAGQPNTPGFPPFWMVNYPPLLADRLVVAPAVPNGGAFLPPHVFGIHARSKLVPMSQNFQLQTPPWSDGSLWPIIRNGSFLYYNFEEGRLGRSTETVFFGDLTLKPKTPLSPPPPPLAKSRLYRILFGTPKPWPTIEAARNYPP